MRRWRHGETSWSLRSGGGRGRRCELKEKTEARRKNERDRTLNCDSPKVIRNACGEFGE